MWHSASENPSLAHLLPPQTTPVAIVKSIGSREIQAAVARLASAISSRHPDPRGLMLLGIADGGIELACRLSRLTGARAGVLDVSFHRDDIGRAPITKARAPTHIPGEVNDATIVLVDDVLFSGRTLKAALNELFDHGRPARVELAVLVDRGCRRLPFAPDYIGFSLQTRESDHVAISLDASAALRDRIRIRSASR